MIERSENNTINGVTHYTILCYAEWVLSQEDAVLCGTPVAGVSHPMHTQIKVCLMNEYDLEELKKERELPEIVQQLRAHNRAYKYFLSTEKKKKNNER